MGNLVKTFIKYRYLLYQLVKKDIKLKYRSSYLGVIWTLLEPLLTMMVLTLVFSTLYGKTAKDFPVYILSGRLIYSFFAGATRSALRSIPWNSSMIKKVYVPKYMYPCAGVISGYVMFLIALPVLAIVAFARGVYPTWYLLQAVVPLVTVFVLGIGAGLLLSTLSVFFRDLEYLWGVALTLIMYACAIFYRVESVVNEQNSWVFKYNPLYAIIENFRNAVFGQPMNMPSMLYAIGFSVILFFVGVFVFYKKQDEFILHI